MQMQRNGQKHDLEIRRGEMAGKRPFPFPRLFSFLQKVFDMDFPLETPFCVVFELPSLRNAQKRHKKNTHTKKRKVPTYLVLPIYRPTSFSGYLPDMRLFQFVFS
jgi:hypothetical protein